jgi:ABC-2 type transport system ATP-binding protein
MMAANRRVLIQCSGVSKSFGRTRALSDLTLTISRGESFGLLGENGAGKSTLVRLLMGFIAPTTGSVQVLGETDVERGHSRIGYVHERLVFEPHFTAQEYLRHFAELAGYHGEVIRSRVEAALAQVHLTDSADRRIGAYSKGMQQRLAIALALLRDPELLILDEPTSGLDPLSQWEIRQVISALHASGRTILLSSHYLAEVEQLCDVVGILRRGRLIRCGSVTELLRVADTVEIVLGGDEESGAITARLGLADAVLEAVGYTLRIPSDAQSRVLARLIEAQIPLVSLNPLSRSLEDVYVQEAHSEPSATQRAADSRRPDIVSKTRHGRHL